MSASKTIPVDKGFGFGVKALKKFPELIPLVGILSAACTMAGTYMAYSLYQKPDVRVVKSSELPPWERVEGGTSQKLLTIKAKYEKNAELEQLRKEIGSYKC